MWFWVFHSYHGAPAYKHFIYLSGVNGREMEGWNKMSFLCEIMGEKRNHFLIFPHSSLSLISRLLTTVSNSHVCLQKLNVLILNKEVNLSIALAIL